MSRDEDVRTGAALPTPIESSPQSYVHAPERRDASPRPRHRSRQQQEVGRSPALEGLDEQAR